MKQKNNLSGKKINDLTVIRYDSNSKKYRRWIVKCKCDKTYSITESFLLYSGRATMCLQCAGKKRRLQGVINYQTWSSIKSGAKTRNIDISILINKKLLWELYLKQNRKCALSGQKIFLPENCPKDHDITASLDRINSSKGYTPSNIQWIHKDINLMKWDYDQNYFLKLCKKVATHNSK